MKLVRWCLNQWDRTAAVALGLASAGALLAGWVGVRRSVFAFEQIPYVISGGLAGLCLIVAAATMWVSADLRDEWRKLDRLEQVMTSAGADRPAPEQR
jgi:hypothetical protein